MINYFILLFAFLTSITFFGQELTGEQLLDKAIAYHDPNGVWETFNGELHITMLTPNKGKRVSEITLNLPKEYYKSEVTKGENTITSTIEKGKCSLKLNGNSNISKKQKDSLRITCERATFMKNYYSYLYGLPMKLKDPGTIITSKTESKSFKGKEYLVLKVTYEKEVGKDTWYFYFNPETYALEVYQFYHDETKNDGEYILLTGESIVNGIKMPKNRAWYYNKNDKYLGIDILNMTN